MSRLRSRIAGGEDGMAVITVMMISVVLSILLATMTTATMRELDQSTSTTRRSSAFQAAEAGIDDYTSKLAEDTQFYLHRVAAGESTRRPVSGADVAANNAWTGATAWSYPFPKNAWRALPSGNGYEYNLQITAPSATQTSVSIVATGRPTGATKGYRTIQVLIQPASIVDFQMIADANISYGSGATTTGKIYAGVGSNLSHSGHAEADLYSEGSISGSPTYVKGAQGYQGANNTIRAKLPTPIQFTSFTGASVDIKAAAQAAGIYLPSDPAIKGWKLVFNTAGTVTISKCGTASSPHLAASPALACTAWTTGNPYGNPATMPLNGAIYSEQTVVVSGVVDGIETVAANDDIVIGGDISYETDGSDVLGLIALNDMVVAAYVNSTMSWRAATIAQNGSWASYSSTQSKTLMTFTGSTATKQGGQMSMFGTRVYNYDDTLLYLRPPYFPFIDKAYTVTLFREMPSGAP